MSQRPARPGGRLRSCMTWRGKLNSRPRFGLTDVTFIHVEGLKVSPEAAGRAREVIAALSGLPEAAAA